MLTMVYTLLLRVHVLEFLKLGRGLEDKLDGSRILVLQRSVLIVNTDTLRLSLIYISERALLISGRVADLCHIPFPFP